MGYRFFPTYSCTACALSWSRPAGSWSSPDCNSTALYCCTPRPSPSFSLAALERTRALNRNQENRCDWRRIRARNAWISRLSLYYTSYLTNVLNNCEYFHWPIAARLIKSVLSPPLATCASCCGVRQRGGWRPCLRLGWVLRVFLLSEFWVFGNCSFVGFVRVG